MHLETEKHQKPRGAHKFWLEFWYTGKSDKIQNIVTCPFKTRQAVQVLFLAKPNLGQSDIAVPP